MKGNKLAFKLETFGNILVFEVLDQCPSVTNSVCGNSLEYASTNNIEIKSVSHVCIYEDAIYIGGVSERIGADSITFDSPKEAEEVKQEFLYALSEWAKNNYFCSERVSVKLIPDSNGVYIL